MKSNKKETIHFAGPINSKATLMCLTTEYLFCRTHLCLWALTCCILLHKVHTMQENINVLYNVMYPNVIRALTIINTIMKCKTHSLESNCTQVLK